MRWVTYHAADGNERVGLLVGEAIHALEPGVALIDLLGDPDTLARAGEQARQRPAETLPLAGAHLCAPIPRPPAVRDFYAFEQHVKTGRQRRSLEMELDWYELPVFYFTNPAGVIGPHDDVPLPPGCQELDFELEVAAVIGPGGSNLSPAEGERHVAGLMVMNDWSARDLQRREMKLNLGPAKGKDFATSLGPYLVTPDEVANRRKGRSYDLTMTARVNGREYSRASLAGVYWSFGEMIAYASRATRLVPGDVIGTGTCGSGCILELSLTYGSQVYPWLKPGDFVELSVEGLGTLANRVVPGPPLIPLR